MKQTKLFILFIGLFSGTAQAQVNYTFEDNFSDYNKLIQNGASLEFGTAALDLQNEGLAYSAIINNYEGLIEVDHRFMHGYMELYRSTEDVNYLKIFVKHAENVLNRRDDNNSSTIGINTPTWSSKNNSVPSHIPYAWIHHDGLITYPLADFAQEVLNDPTLEGVVADSYDPVVALGNLPLKTPFSFEGLTFKEIADEIVIQVRKTIDYHHDNDEWRPETEAGIEEGHYAFVWDAAHDISVAYNNGDYIPLNMQSAMGRCMLMMYKATEDNFYLDKVRRLANNLRDNIVENGAYPTQYLWYYDDADDSNPYAGTPYSEDLSHAGINAHFMYLCYKENIQYDAVGSGPVFDLTDMQKIAETFKGTYKGPLDFWERIDGTDDGTGWIGDIGLWTVYSEFDKDIYHIVADVYGLQAQVNASLPLLFLPAAKDMEAFAMLDLYQNLFNIIYIGQNGEASNWVETAVGDFNNDGIKEIAAVRNFDGDVYIWEFIGGKMVHAQTIPWGAASNWKGLDVGNVDGIPGDELILIRDYDNTIFVFKNSGASVNLLEMASARKTNGALTNWQGMAAGDFDGDGKDEYATVNNDNGDTYVFELNIMNETVLKAVLANGSGSQWAGIAAGNLDGSGVDEFVQVRNFDGNIYAYQYNNGTGMIETFAAPLIYNSNALDWRGIELGDFDSDCRDEIIANMASNGDHYFYEISGSGPGNYTLVFKNREHFVTELENGIIGTGDLSSNCGTNNAELVNFRNKDGWVNIYEVTLSSCAFCVTEHEEGGKVRRGGPFGQKTRSQNSVLIYPNPSATGNFEISGEGIIQIVVTDLLGNVVLNEKTIDNHSFIHLNGHAKGTYLVQITTEDTIHTRKIVYE